MSRHQSHYRQFPCNPHVNTLVDWLYGKEAQPDATGALARFVRTHVRVRPALGDTSQWSDIDAMKAHAAESVPSFITAADFDAVVAAAGG